MMGLSDILTAVQNGVVALNNLDKQVNGSLLNISGQLSAKVSTIFGIRDMTAANGSVSYTGIGFTPKLVIFFGTISTGQLGMAGVDVGTAPRAFINFATIPNWGSTGASSVYFSADAGVTVQEAHITSFDADGFTLLWTKTGAPAAGNGFFSAIAFR